MDDGTPQFMSRDCGRGFIEDEVTEERSFLAIAAFYEVPPVALLAHPYNASLKRLRVIPEETRPGDRVLIPREMTSMPMLWARYLKPESFA